MTEKQAVAWARREYRKAAKDPRTAALYRLMGNLEFLTTLPLPSKLASEETVEANRPK